MDLLFLKAWKDRETEWSIGKPPAGFLQFLHIAERPVRIVSGNIEADVEKGAFSEA